jgi:exosortase/archaeosortase family protein
MSLSEKWRQVPGPVKLFLLKGSALFFVWKLMYLGFLLPNRLLDRPLTHFVGVGTVATLNLFTHSSEYSVKSEADERIVGVDRVAIREEVERLYRGPDRILSIADVCNGLEVMVLYAGFIFCWPAGPSARGSNRQPGDGTDTRQTAVAGASSVVWLRKFKFLACGFALILLLNIFRCAALAIISQHKPEYVDFYHHYLFTFIIYGVIFWLWYLFTQRPALPSKRILNVTTTIGE